MRVKLSSEFLLSELKRYYEIHKKTPTSSDLNNDETFPSVGYYRHGFGRFSQAIILAGLPYDKKIVLKKDEKDDIYKLIIDDYLIGLTLEEIAKKHGYTNGATIANIVKKFDINKRTRQWTTKEIDLLKTNYGKDKSIDMTTILTRWSKAEISAKAHKLKIKNESHYWSDAEKSYLIKNYESMNLKEISLELNRSIKSVSTKAIDLNLTKSQIWTEEEDAILISLHPDIPNKDIEKIILGRTKDSIVMRASILGLKKSTEYWNSLKEFNKDDLLNMLIDFSDQLGRTPTQDELMLNPNMHSSATYRRYFDSYSSACIEAGLEPNNLIFGVSHVCYSENGDLCLSKFEQTITKILIENKINYKKEVMYSEIIDDDRCGLKRVDWLIENQIVVEFFGMPDKESYSKRIDEKALICHDNCIPLISLYPSDLLKKNEKELINKFNKHGINIKL